MVNLMVWFRSNSTLVYFFLPLSPSSASIYTLMLALLVYCNFCGVHSEFIAQSQLPHFLRLCNPSFIGCIGFMPGCECSSWFNSEYISDYSLRLKTHIYFGTKKLSALLIGLSHNLSSYWFFKKSVNLYHWQLVLL